VLKEGYNVVSCEQYAKIRKHESSQKMLINRIDIDFSIKKAERLLDIFERLGIKGTFFVRLHAKEYNPFSFEHYRIIKRIIASGNEVGYHSEIVDESEIWSENASDCLARDILLFNMGYDVKIKGVASHGGMTGNNNLEFWKNHDPIEFGLEYEAYDFFDESFYVSDSEWTQWKCYNHGTLIINNRRSLAEHAQDDHKVIYALIHSDTYYDRHIYE